SLAWSLATVDHVHRPFLAALADAPRKRWRDFDAPSLANVAWAYAALREDRPVLFDEIADAAVGEKINDFNHQGLCQLHQWNLWRKEKTGKSALPPLVAKLCHDAFARTSIHKSALQRDVASQLAKMGLLLEEEALTPSGYRLDSLVEINGNKIGSVEVDGPAHFVGQRPHGKTVLKRRQVAKVDGIPVVSLPYWEWNDLDSDDEKQRYIRSKIDGC
ncbi:hypothetical protein ACHAWF_018959, partial [Thalassiosira exigua]